MRPELQTTADQNWERDFAEPVLNLSDRIKTIGDSVMAVFRSVDAALDYAFALHIEPGHQELQVRAGIHIGSVDVVGDDVFGTEVALARRVVDAIEGAEIWLSNRAKEDLDRAGAHRQTGLQWQAHDVELKGIGAERLWSLVSKPPLTSVSPAGKTGLPMFKGAESKDGVARFRSAGEPIGVGSESPPFGIERDIFLSPGPAMWLRLMPVVSPGMAWPSHKLKDHASRSGANFAPFYISFVNSSTLHFLRAQDGFGIYFAVGAAETNSVVFAFRTGEIWSVDTGLLASCPDDLPELLIEKAYGERLQGYARFLQNIDISPPYHWIAGLIGVKNRRLEVRNHSFPGPLCLAEMISVEGLYSPEQMPETALHPFFERIFEECGIPRSSCP